MFEFLSTLGICEGAAAALGVVTKKIMGDDKRVQYRIPKHCILTQMMSNFFKSNY